MNEKTRYRLFKLFLIFTILNVIGILLYEGNLKNGLLKQRPEFYVESVKPEKKSGENDLKEAEIKENNIEENEGERRDGAGKSLEEKNATERKVLIIGDSNIYLMSQNEGGHEKKYAEKIYWLAESGAKTDFISDGLKVELGKIKPQYVRNTLTRGKKAELAKEIEEKGITDVAVLLGVNSLGTENLQKLNDVLLKLSKISQVYYVSLLPYADKKKYGIKNEDIVRFNNLMKKNLSGSKVSYIDAYSKIASMPDYHSETSDGLHYSRKIYDEVLAEIMKNVVQIYQK